MEANKVIGIFLLFFLALGGVTSCSSTNAAPTPTNTLQPISTNTPVPTATNTATPADTPSPIATPDLKATQAAENEQMVKGVLTKLKLDLDTGHLGWYQDEPISVSIEGFKDDYRALDETFNAADFVMYSEMSWKSDSWPYCGVLFRANDQWTKGDTYFFLILRFSGLPAWDIELRMNGKYLTTITGEPLFTDYLDISEGGKNKFILVAKDNKFKVYINGNYEGQYYDWSKKLTDGNIAFYAFQLAGNTTCTFDNSWVWVYK